MARFGVRRASETRAEDGGARNLFRPPRMRSPAPGGLKSALRQAAGAANLFRMGWRVSGPARVRDARRGWRSAEFIPPSAHAQPRAGRTEVRAPTGGRTTRGHISTSLSALQFSRAPHPMRLV